MRGSDGLECCESRASGLWVCGRRGDLPLSFLVHFRDLGGSLSVHLRCYFYMDFFFCCYGCCILYQQGFYLSVVDSVAFPPRSRGVILLSDSGMRV